MKLITTSIVAFAMCLGALHLTSCKAFSKSDAQALGAQIAKSSLEVAAKAANGEPVDFKASAALIGLQAASSAINTVNFNLNSGTNATSTTPKEIVASSHDVAQNVIAGAAVPDPQIAAKASEIATQAVAVAQGRLNGADAAPGN